jgi:hypothetical protein
VDLLLVDSAAPDVCGKRAGCDGIDPDVVLGELNGCLPQGKGSGLCRRVGATDHWLSPQPETEAMTTIRPRPSRGRWRAAAWTAARTPSRLTAATRPHVEGSTRSSLPVSVPGPGPEEIPAFANTVWSPPGSAAAVAMARSIAAGFVTTSATLVRMAGPLPRAWLPLHQVFPYRCRPWSLAPRQGRVFHRWQSQAASGPGYQDPVPRTSKIASSASPGQGD